VKKLRQKHHLSPLKTSSYKPLGDNDLELDKTPIIAYISSRD